MNQKQYRNWLGGFNPRMENQWNIQQQYRQQMQQQNAQEPPQQQQRQWQQQQCGDQTSGQLCHHQQCDGQQGLGKQHQLFNCNKQQNQSLLQPPQQNFQNGYHQRDGQELYKRKTFIDNLLYNPEDNFINDYPQQHIENRIYCQQDNPGQGNPGLGSGSDHRQAIRLHPYGQLPPPHPTEFRYHPRPQGYLPRANFIPPAHRPPQPLVYSCHPPGPFHQGPNFPLRRHPEYLRASYPTNLPGQFPMNRDCYQDWAPSHFGGYGYPLSFQAGTELSHNLQEPAQDYQLPLAQYTSVPSFGGMFQNGQGPPVPSNVSNGRENCGNPCQQPQVNHVSCGGEVNITKVKESNQMRYSDQPEEVQGSISPNHPSDNRPCEMTNAIYNEQGNTEGKSQFSSEQVLMPKIMSKRNNLNEWRVVLDCPGWQNAFLQVEWQEENRSSTHRKNKNWIYVRGKRDVKTEAGSVLVKFEKKIEAPTSVDRTLLRAEMNNKGKLAIIADKKQQGNFRSVCGNK